MLADPIRQRVWRSMKGSIRSEAAVIHRCRCGHLGSTRAGWARAWRTAPVAAIVVTTNSIAELQETLHRQRIDTCRGIAERLVGRGTRANQLADSLYALLGVECHDLLVVRRGWTRRRWERWVETCLQTVL